MITFYSKNSSPRLQYVLKIIFTEVLMIDYVLVDDPDIFQNIDSIKINYSEEIYPNSLLIKPSGLLDEHKIAQKFIKTGQWKNVYNIC